MKRLICAVVTALLLASNPAFARDGFAVGLSAARAAIDVNAMDMNIDGDSNGWRLFGQYKFTDKLSVEAGMSSFGRPDDATIPSNLEVEAESFDLFAVGTLPVTDKFDVFGKAGFVQWNTEVEENDQNEVNKSSTDLAFAFGGEYELTRRLAVRGEYQWSDSKSTGAPTMWSVAGIFRFQ